MPSPKGTRQIVKKVRGNKSLGSDRTMQLQMSGESFEAKKSIVTFGDKSMKSQQSSAVFPRLPNMSHSKQ